MTAKTPPFGKKKNGSPYHKALNLRSNRALKRNIFTPSRRQKLWQFVIIIQEIRQFNPNLRFLCAHECKTMISTMESLNVGENKRFFDLTEGKRNQLLVDVWAHQRAKVSFFLKVRWHSNRQLTTKNGRNTALNMKPSFLRKY